MRIGVAFSPTSDWPGVLTAARLADESGLASVGFWDHYHSERTDWGYIAGWAAHAGLAMATERIAITPMVICNLNHELGQLAKESSILSILSNGRFELAIGAGDYPVEYRSWMRPFPPVDERLARLLETIAALRSLWTGQPVTRDGTHVRLAGAISAPAPPSPPRVIVGVGASRRLIDLVVQDADELNVYLDPAVMAHATEAIAAAGRDIPLSGRDIPQSGYRNYDWGGWPADLVGDLAQARDGGLSRVVVNVGFERDMAARVRELAVAQERLV